MEQHLTVDAFVVHEGRLALHWHRKNAMWLPAGGHLEPGEDPASAALREIREEFAIEAEIMRVAPRVEYEGGPEQLEPPFTILDCWDAPDHRHISMVYFCRLLDGFPGESYEPGSPVLWLDADALSRGSAEVDGREVAFTPDVQRLGLEALKLAASALKAGAA